MRLRVCSEPGCPELQPETRCAAHRSAREKQRGTRQARGYDKTYDKHRQRAANQVATGLAICWSCNRTIKPGTPWHDGHCENDRAIIHGPEHQACNLGHIGQPCPHASHARSDISHP